MHSLEKKLYQLIIDRLEGGRIHIQAYRDRISKLIDKGIGGFIIFGGIRDEVKSFIEEMQSVSEIPLFIASDVERGVGQQIVGATSFPCQMAISAAIDRSDHGDVDVFRSAIEAVAHESRDVGINLPLIPVLDVNRNPDNPIICTRAFSDRPEEVAWFGSEYINILEGSGLVSCAKHFPGHGDTETDSHIELPVINKSYRDLIAGDIIPFTEAIHAGVGSVMVGHLCIPALDDRPASLSKKIISDILRGELGFAGLVMTDALNMSALKGIGDVSAECLKAGADVLLHPDECDVTVKELVSAVRSGTITLEQIEAAVDRILKTKERLKTAGRSEVDHPRHKILSSRIVERSISLLKDAPGLLPIRDRGEVVLILAGDEQVYKSTFLARHFEGVSALHGNKEETGVIDEKIFAGQIVIFAIFTSVSAWRGSSGISVEEKDRILNLIQKADRSVVVSFGSPYVLRGFNSADVLIAAYEATEEAQMATVKCLEGQLAFRGRLPVRIDL